jgi:hypothetical protein
MKKLGLMVLMGSLLSTPMVMAEQEKNDYPTKMRVQYVLDCMDSHPKMNVYESVHKCSCVIDKIAEKLTDREFDDGAVTFKLKNLPADRGGVFRDNDEGQESLVSLKQAQEAAYDSCKLKR